MLTVSLESEVGDSVESFGRIVSRRLGGRFNKDSIEGQLAHID
jgi:hypothetical protein